MAELKQAHLDVFIAPQDQARFHSLVLNVGQRHATSPLLKPLGVEVVTEEAGQTSLGSPYLQLGLWFEGPYAAYWFALYLREAMEAWQGLTPQQEGGQADG